MATKATKATEARLRYASNRASVLSAWQRSGIGSPVPIDWTYVEAIAQVPV